jgi:hypothetical protein
LGGKTKSKAIKNLNKKMRGISEKLRLAYNKTAKKHDTELQPDWKLVEREKFSTFLVDEQ